MYNTIQSPDSQRSVHETVNVFFTQWVHCKNITYTDYLSDLSKVQETAVRTAPAHRSFSGIIVNTRVFDDVCVDLLCSF